MKNFYLKPGIEQGEAVKAIKAYQSNLIMKWQQLFKKNNKNLTSMEMLYLPYWCFDYHYQSKQMKDGIQGKVAVETYKHHTAILPDKTKFHEPVDHLSLLPVNGEPVPEVARQQIYWEAFGREKKRIDISIEITDTATLYVPYWIGYVQGKEVEIIVVDATNGKIDLGIKEAVLEAIMANAR